MTVNSNPTVMGKTYMLIHGKNILDNKLPKLEALIKNYPKKLKLGAISVGTNPSVLKFIQLKKRLGERINIEVSGNIIPKDSTFEEIAQKIAIISKNHDGLFIELPIPENYNRQIILDLIPPEKDVDLLSSVAQKKYYESDFSLLPPAVEALATVFNEYKINLSGKTAAVFGQGLLIGQPISFWLESQNVKVYKIDEHTKEPETLSQQADIVISGVGKPALITSEMIKEGAIIIDYGYSLKDGKSVGDVDRQSVETKASLLAAVPGGIGPLVILAVFENLIKLNS